MDSGQAKNVLRLRRTSEVRGRLDISGTELYHLFDGIHDCTHECAVARGRHHLDDDDAGSFAVVLGGQLKFRAQIKHRDNRAAEVDDTFYMCRHSGHGRDMAKANDLPNIQHGQSIGFVA